VTESSDLPATDTADLEQLVGEWLTVPDVAERYGLPLTHVRRWIQDRELLGVRLGERHVLKVPGRFLGEDGPLTELRGTFTVLSDGGMDDAEALRWLFTPDATLPAPGAPVDSLIAGFKTEVRRRAMELAF
jgi:excisionase family DNA binding protein